MQGHRMAPTCREIIICRGCCSWRSETPSFLLSPALLVVDNTIDRQDTIANMSFSSFKNPATYHLLRYQATVPALNPQDPLTQAQLWHPPGLNALPVLRLRHRSLPRPPSSSILDAPEAHLPRLLHTTNPHSRRHAAHVPTRRSIVIATIPLFLAHLADSNR